MPTDLPAKKLNIVWDPAEPSVLYFEDGSVLRGPSIEIQDAPGGGVRAAIVYRASGGYSELYAESLAMRNKVGNDGVQH